MSLFNFLGEFALFNMVCDWLFGKPKDSIHATTCQDYQSEDINVLDDRLDDLQEHLDELQAKLDSCDIYDERYDDLQDELDTIQDELDELESGSDW